MTGQYYNRNIDNEFVMLYALEKYSIFALCFFQRMKKVLLSFEKFNKRIIKSALI